MKLLRYGIPGHERPGLLDAAGRIRDLTAHIDDVGAHALNPETLKRLNRIDPNSLPIVETPQRLGACIANVGKFICVGLNYTDHALETGKEPPSEPVLFLKATSAICGPDDDIELPRRAEKLDWEVELGIVIGKGAKYVNQKEALDHVAGYCLVNDVSERSFQSERGGQWTKGKSHDTFGPIGPHLLTADEVPDPQNIALWLDVDGKRYQDGNTSNMIFGVAYLVSYISQFMTLLPGDIIATGTPAGVGLGLKPQLFLRPGQSIVLGGTNLGEQRHKVVTA